MMSHDCAGKQWSQVITTHARMRMTARRVSETALSAVFRLWGVWSMCVERRYM